MLFRSGSYLFPKAIAKKALYFFATPQCIARPPSEMAWFESSKKFKFGTGIAAFEWGNPDGPLVILLHGWSGRGTQMGAFAAPLVEKNYRVIALDGPAHGDSAGEMTNPGDFANCLLQAQKEFGKIKAVIAHSFGGGSSVLAVSRGLRLEKLVLVASQIGRAHV